LAANARPHLAAFPAAPICRIGKPAVPDLGKPATRPAPGYSVREHRSRADLLAVYEL